MAEGFDIDLHPQRMVNITVSQFELDSLYEAHAKTCIQLKAFKSDYSILKTKFDEAQAQLGEANTQLDNKNVKVAQLIQQLAQQIVRNFFLQRRLLNGRGVEKNDGATQTWPESILAVQEAREPAQEDTMNSEYVCPRKNDSTEAALKDKLFKIEALYDIIQRENESMARQMAKLSSKLRILSMQNEDLDQYLGTTIRKQGRFEIRKWLECDQCYRGFSSHEEMKRSVCHFHPMQAVPYDDMNGKKYYYLCCSGLVKNKGQASGCCKGKHRLSIKQNRT
ncbi:hypothetical protein EGW08_015842 [Elysia chlorotica]|uniref:Uncharacterized protein n=1 Tax=Elysia chlorotica TaxID=188477 RepID=A0A3S0ZJS2_ELYCH|nr:hypothetical protein EGW08_015842 [Elysia chlorotica]